MVDDERQDEQDEQPAEEAPAAGQEPEGQPTADASAEEPVEPAADEPAPATDEAGPTEPDEPAAEQEQSEGEAPGAPTSDEPSASERPEAAEQAPAEQSPAAEPPPAAEQPRPRPRRERKQGAGADEPEVIPGAHLEPDLVLEEEVREEDVEFDRYATEDAELVATSEQDEPTDEGDDDAQAPGPLASTVLELAADARYRATGKRKGAVARVTLKPGTGRYTINGRDLESYFPRGTLQTRARRPLETVGQEERMDVVATIRGGGVSAQAGALRHGITRALVEADPNLRGELKRRGYLTRDPRVKERKKAGLKKARKRPQFSKR